MDVIVIGGGHNGLTAANYLAMGGLKVCVLEQRHIVGGAAVSEEFHPGFRNSVASFLVSLLRNEVIEELRLSEYGYSATVVETGFYPDSNGDYLLLNGDDLHDRREIARFSNSDFDNLNDFHAVVDKVGAVLSEQWLREPPRLHGGGVSDLLDAVKLGLDIRKLDAEARWRFLQFFLGPPDTIIERWFDSEKVKAMIAASITPGNYASLQQPGASLAMLHHAVGEVAGEKGAWGIVPGGMGTITQAMAKSALDKGVDIRINASVEKIIVESGMVKGVRLLGGEELFAPIVAANTDPNRTFLKLVGKEHLPDAFARDIEGFRQESASLRINLALSGLPDFACLPGTELAEHHRSSMMMVESKDHIEQAYASAKLGIPANPPIIEALIPSTMDDSLTDEPDTHVMSLLCKYMPYELADGEHWDDAKPRVFEQIMDHVQTMVPNIREIVVGHQCLSPLDLERMFGMTRGDICHGKLEPDQLFSARPHPDAAQYSTPVKGLYLCGSGAHPGGGVTGAPGRNAAKKILRSL
ncbi:MAG: NAD(P)/FAD-dependent oxidoreductase [Pseudomonadales bacterium]|nr:NAD(P)/FAD-dependent oxidoreductase [Pseudomonadales bacterium]MBO7005149.1 NAD(P)/FAD-dependent oxidoreductase [Pseudomonadales bacterium]